MVDTRDSKSLACKCVRVRLPPSLLNLTERKIMNKYKMYGIGNALLDYEYKVNDEVLKSLGLDKGCMLLNEYNKHFNVHNSLRNIRPPEKIVPGGSVANSIVGLSQLGNEVGFIGKVSDDELGGKYEEGLKQENVQYFYSKKKEELPTGTCLTVSYTHLTLPTILLV